MIDYQVVFQYVANKKYDEFIVFLKDEFEYLNNYSRFNDNYDKKSVKVIYSHLMESINLISSGELTAKDELTQTKKMFIAIGLFAQIENKLVFFESIQSRVDYHSEERKKVSEKVSKRINKSAETNKERKLCRNNDLINVAQDFKHLGNTTAIATKINKNWDDIDEISGYKPLSVDRISKILSSNKI